jgi:tau tubulin kinase
MTRRFREQNGEFRKSRTYAGFRGTLRYVSLTVHERRDQGPVDDFWSLLYSIIELCEGSLPWKSIEDDDDMALKKKKTPIEEMLM